MLKASVIHVYVVMWCKGLQLRSPARLHSTLYLETKHPAATNGMPWIRQCHIPSALPTPAYLRILPCGPPTVVAVGMLIARTT
jgi:hypothetical protein